IRLLANVERTRSWGTSDKPEPAPKEVQMAGPCRQLQGVEPGGEPIAQGQILPVERAHQPLESPVLIENHLSTALPRAHGHEKSDQHRLPRAGRTTDEGMAR